MDPIAEENAAMAPFQHIVPVVRAGEEQVGTRLPADPDLLHASCGPVGHGAQVGCRQTLRQQFLFEDRELHRRPRPIQLADFYDLVRQYRSLAEEKSLVKLTIAGAQQLVADGLHLDGPDRVEMDAVEFAAERLTISLQPGTDPTAWRAKAR